MLFSEKISISEETKIFQANFNKFDRFKINLENPNNIFKVSYVIDELIESIVELS